MTLLSVQGLTKAFGGVHAVADLTFTVDPGRVHSIIGPNGAGKTTLFNLVTGIYTPTAGRISLGRRGRDGADHVAARRQGHRPHVPEPADLLQHARASRT